MAQGLIERVGIDRSTVCNFDLVAIDTKRFKQAVSMGAKGGYESTKDESTAIVIPDVDTGVPIAIKRLWLNAFDVGDLSIQWSKDNLHHTEQLSTKLAVNVNATRNNLQNLTVDGYKARLEQVFITLAQVYGIYIDRSNLLVKQIEINVSIVLSKPFSEYRQAIDLFRLNLPSSEYSYNKNRDVVKSALWTANNAEAQQSELETIYVNNSRVELKIYNKIQQLIDTEVVEEQEANVLRIEYKILKQDILESVFNDASVNSLTDKGIKELFWKYFNRDIVKQFDKWHENNLKQLEATLRRHVEASRRYVAPFMLECRRYKEQHGGYPLLFDVEDLRYALKAVMGTRNLARRFKRMCDNVANERDLFGNLEKVLEIIVKVTQACIQ